jgi:DNA-binding protein HU-beta
MALDLIHARLRAGALSDRLIIVRPGPVPGLDEPRMVRRQGVEKGNKVRITGLGILQVRKRAARMGRNPATGESIKIKASKKVAFRPAKELKESI